MSNISWEKLFYTEGEFATLYSISEGFNDDINRNCRTRDDDSRFATFIDAGSDALLRDNLDFVAGLI